MHHEKGPTDMCNLIEPASLGVEATICRKWRATWEVFDIWSSRARNEGV